MGKSNDFFDQLQSAGKKILPVTGVLMFLLLPIISEEILRCLFAGFLVVLNLYVKSYLEKRRTERTLKVIKGLQKTSRQPIKSISISDREIKIEFRNQISKAIKGEGKVNSLTIIKK